jgi:hypothetical protein
MSTIIVIKHKVVAKGGESIYDGESLSEADHAFEIFMSQLRESDDMVTIFH